MYAHHDNVEQLPGTRFEHCRQLFIELRFRLRAEDRDIDQIVWLYKEISAYPLGIQSAALDAVVDHQGW